jgi:hypothetical protein
MRLVVDLANGAVEMSNSETVTPPMPKAKKPHSGLKVHRQLRQLLETLRVGESHTFTNDLVPGLTPNRLSTLVVSYARKYLPKTTKLHYESFAAVTMRMRSIIGVIVTRVE